MKIKIVENARLEFGILLYQPVTATTFPSLWRASTILSFCCGLVLANTISGYVSKILSNSNSDISFKSVPVITAAVQADLRIDVIEYINFDVKDVKKAIFKSLVSFLVLLTSLFPKSSIRRCCL